MRDSDYGEVDTGLTDEQVKQKLDQLLAAQQPQSEVQMPAAPVAQLSALDNLLQEESQLPVEEPQMEQTQQSPTGPQVGPSRVDYAMQSAFKPELQDPELKKLLEAQRNTMNETGFQRAAQGLIQSDGNVERITRGEAPRYDTDPYGILAEQEKRAAQPIKDLAARRSAEVQDIDTQKNVLNKQETQDENDPQSPRSKLFQEAARKMGLDKYLGDALDKMPASALQKYLPMDINMQTVEANKELAKARLDESKDARQERKTQRDQEQTDKAFDELAKRTDPARSIRGNLGEQARVAMRANAGLELVKGKDFNKVTDIEMKELARTLEGVLSGGVGTIQGAKALVPKTAQGSIIDAMQWVTNKPQGKEQKEFVGLLTKALERQKEVAEGNVKKMQSEVMRTAAPKLKQKDPERWQMFVDELGLDQDAKPRQAPTQTAPAAPKAPAPAASDRVSVVSPTGKQGSVPKSQLDSALKQGYKVK